ncbi:MAG: hypothetical protein RAO75_05055 [Candidatus Chlorobium antarcticum]|jgi:DNA-binding CsgD family transcriptional regulator|nr:hypothetical protein [Candidatus Chlorobium antarcticum]
MEHNQATSSTQDEITRLRQTATDNEAELERVAGAQGNNRTTLLELLNQLHALPIDMQTRRSMTSICLELADQQKLEEYLGVDLTQSDFSFLQRLKEKHPVLNRREQKIALFIKINYSTVHIAKAVGISARGMESIRYRMHKKLGLQRHQSIKTYLGEL